MSENHIPHLSTEQIHERLVQAVADYAIYMIGLDGLISTWNAGAERIKGYTAEEIIGRHFSTFYTPEDRAAGKPEQAIETALRTGRFEDEAWRIRKDGSRFWAMAVLDAIRDDSGQVIGFAKITRDMTAQHEAQIALIESERRFRLLVERVVDYAIFMLDPNGIVTNWNAGAQRIKGYTAGEIVGHHFSTFYTEEDRQAGVPRRALETARNEGRFVAEGWRVRKDGTRFWASVVIDAIHDDDGELIGFTKVTRDITEQYETQKRLSDIREQLFQSQKMEAIGQITGGMAHDFNNLLTAILGSADLLRRQAEGNERMVRHAENIRSAAQRGAEITRQLLSFARRKPAEPKIVDLNNLLPSAVNLLRQSLRGDISLVLEAPDNIWRVEAEPSQLELALLNLTLNARDAMTEGGTVHLTAANVSLEGEVSDLIGEFVAISISDTGAGIPEEIRNRIFEPFFTTKSFGKGTGLGLAQVFGFVKQARGGITVDSELGQGTTVTMYLPAKMIETPHARSTNGTTPAVSAKRILMVEDEAVLAEVGVDLLSEMGYEVEIVHGGKEALALLQRGGRFDLIFADIVMPGGISGLELARRIRRNNPELPILLATGYSESLVDQVIEFPVLPKPYEYDDLSQAVTALLKAGRPG